MGKYMRKHKVIGEIAVMEVTSSTHNVGVKTRGRTLAMAEESGGATKRSKVDSGGLEFSSSFHQLRNHRRRPITPEISVSSENSENSTRVVVSSDRYWSTHSCEQLTSSRCSSNGSCELVNGILRSGFDQESEDFQFENSKFLAACRERRETTPSSALSAESNELESIAMPTSEANSRRKSSNAKRMPSEAEIENFFCVAEKVEQKRFAEKYNYDIVKDVPFEGRYEWVPMKQ